MARKRVGLHFVNSAGRRINPRGQFVKQPKRMNKKTPRRIITSTQYRYRRMTDTQLLTIARNENKRLSTRRNAMVEINFRTQKYSNRMSRTTIDFFWNMQYDRAIQLLEGMLQGRDVDIQAYRDWIYQVVVEEGMILYAESQIVAGYMTLASMISHEYERRGDRVRNERGQTY